MSTSGAFILVASSMLSQLCAGWVAVLPIGALALYGWFRGAFLATLAGLQVLAAFLAAMALARPVSALVESLWCPAAQSLAVAYALVLAICLTGGWLAVGAWVPEGACKLGPLFDPCAGVAVGGCAGVALGGALLVGWSMADMPTWFRLDARQQPLDSGGRMLRTFARFSAREATPWTLLLDGDRPVQSGDEAGVIRASEPFADTDRDGTWDAGMAGDTGAEPYLDVDGDGGFTRDMGWHDADGDGRRAAGLRDCHRLADWRHVRVMHAPRIDSAAAAEVVENTPAEEPVYETHAADVDGDTVTFGIEPVEEGGELGAEIDPVTGVVTLVESADFERSKSHAFVVVATDATGQSTRKQVRLRVRDVPLESSPSR